MRKECHLAEAAQSVLYRYGITRQRGKHKENRQFTGGFVTYGLAYSQTIENKEALPPLSLMNTDDLLQLIGHRQPLFGQDIAAREEEMRAEIGRSRFLVLGGAGSIGQAVVKEIFERQPAALHVVDISENNLVELVRDIRSSLGYLANESRGEFATRALDIGSREFDAFMQASDGYDYVLNLSALKHVRSEKDPYTLMRMIQTNIVNTDKTLKQAIACGAKHYFCVSTDKAANPVNMMGASKRIMEMFLQRHRENIKISSARFANVLFSDGSLPFGFQQRLQKGQPLVAPNDISRYFVTAKEAGSLCLLATLLGENCDIFFPRLSDELHLVQFSTIAEHYLRQQGFEPLLLDSEQQAREFMLRRDPWDKQWACYFSASDTTGEKPVEEFYRQDETLDLDHYKDLGVVKNSLSYQPAKLEHFEQTIGDLVSTGSWDKKSLVQLFLQTLPEFEYEDVGRYLDQKM